MKRNISINDFEGFTKVRTYSYDFLKLRNIIRERDNFTCQECNKFEEILDVHHIDFNKNNNAPLNLITLCHSCHSKTNYNREFYIKKYTR